MKTIQGELKNLRHKQQLLGILLFSLVTIVVWVSISLITSQSSTSISSALLRLAQPLNPSVNVEVLSALEEKTWYDPSQLNSFPIFTLLSAEEIAAGVTAAPASSSALQSLTTSLALPLPEAEPVASESAVATESGSVVASPTPSASPNPSPSPSPTAGTSL